MCFVDQNEPTSIEIGPLQHHQPTISHQQLPLNQAHHASTFIGVIFVLLAVRFQHHFVARCNHHRAHHAGRMDAHTSVWPVDVLDADQPNCVDINLQAPG